MMTITVNLPELEIELESIAAAQHTGVDSIVMGALAQCFNKPKLLNSLGFVTRPMSVPGLANS